MKVQDRNNARLSLLSPLARFSDEDLAKIDIAQANGIVNADLTMLVCRWIKFPFWVACAVLERETGGGKNIWGGDDTQFQGHHNMRVTQEHYEAYRIERQAGHGQQGVGPLQLTWAGFQDDADALGGTWIPLCNLITGLDALNQWWDANKDWHVVFDMWNDETYADAMVNVALPKWALRFGVKFP